MPKTLYKISKTSFLNKTPEKFWVDEGTEYGETFQKFARRKTLKFTQQWVKQKLPLQREQLSLKNI